VGEVHRDRPLNEDAPRNEQCREEAVARPLVDERADGGADGGADSGAAQPASNPPSGFAALLSGLWSRAYLLLTITALFWAGNSIVGRAAHGSVPPTALAFWRWSLAFAVLLPFAWRLLRRDWRAMLRAWRVMVPMALLGICTFNLMLYTGLSHTTAMNGLLIQSAQPAIIMALGILFMGDHVGWRQWLGLALSILGVMVILTGGHLDHVLDLRLNAGDALIAAGLLAWGAYSVLLRKRPAVHPLSFLIIVIGLGLCGIFPFYMAELASGARIDAHMGSALAIIYVGIFPSVISYLFFNRGVELLGSAQAGLFVNIMPIMGAGLAILFLGESFRPFHLVGLLLALMGIAVSGQLIGARGRKSPS
jgi:drug/metabolite transporter (DMT)-like permease